MTKLGLSLIYSILLINTAQAGGPGTEDTQKTPPRPTHASSDYKVLMPGVVPNQASWLCFMWGHLREQEPKRSKEK